MSELQYTTEMGYWLGQIETYDKKFLKWQERSKKIVKRYRDERPETEARASKFNILWSNVQTLQPALYSTPPKPNIERRFQDDDDLGRIASQVLERATSYFVQQDIFHESVRQSVLDRLLSGRGTVWVRYEPVFSEEVQLITEDAPPELETENAVIDYVHWQDFGHTWGRTWQEVRAVWRKVYMGKAELVKRFGEAAEGISYETEGESDKVCVYEIWDSKKKRVMWLCKGKEDFLEVQDDPLGLDGFFPCPRPLFATLSNDDLVPTPDFALYQDQANLLDSFTARIASITKALKVAGVYDKSAEGVSRLLSEGIENQLIPVDQWAVFGEKGGLKGVVDFMPIEAIVTTLASLYDARERVKAEVYEITGISDIIRGAGKASETATAQRIKGQYATLRLDTMQGDVARFSRDLVKLVAEIIAEHFDLETIKALSGIKLASEQEKMMLKFKAQSQPLSEKEQEMLNLPTWEQVFGLLKDDAARSFRIDIETDSTIKTDQEAEKAARIEFLTAASQFIASAQQVQIPEMQPVLMEMLMFGVRGFKVGRELESTLNIAIDKIKKASEQPQQPVEDPSIAIAAQQEQAKSQFEQMKLQAEMQKQQDENMRFQAELEQKSQSEALERELKLQMKQMDIQATKDIELMRIQADFAKMQVEQPEAPEMENSKENDTLAMLAETQAYIADNTNQALSFLAQSQQQNTQILAEAINKPKSVNVVRDNSGRMVGAEVE